MPAKLHGRPCNFTWTLLFSTRSAETLCNTALFWFKTTQMRTIFCFRELYCMVRVLMICLVFVLFALTCMSGLPTPHSWTPAQHFVICPLKWVDGLIVKVRSVDGLIVNVRSIVRSFVRSFYRCHHLRGRFPTEDIIAHCCVWLWRELNQLTLLGNDH